MYERSPVVAELNQVPGFDPFKLLRRITSPETGEEVLQLELPYKKLWFRLAYPKGRIRLNALRITEQMAIYEAQIFLDRTDENPIGSFTSSCTKEEAPGGQYIQAAQRAAMDEALSDAGFGIQFVDGNTEIGLPVQGRKRIADSLPVDTENSFGNQNSPAQSVTEVKSGQTVEVQEDAENDSLPVGPEENAPEGVQTAETGELPVKTSGPESLPAETTARTHAAEGETSKTVQGIMDLLGGRNASAKAAASSGINTGDIENAGDGEKRSVVQELPVRGEAVQEKTNVRYTPDMPVEEIVKRMTVEEAGQVVVDTGVCKGQTLAEVAERRPPSLKFYLYGGYRGDNNILRAAAKIMLESLAAGKAG